MYCKNCGIRIPDDSKFCFSCGTQVEKIIIAYCPSCGAQAPENAAFCLQCGAKLSVEQTAEDLLPPDEKLPPAADGAVACLYDVELTEAGPNAKNVVSLVHDLIGLGFIEAQDLVGTAPKILKRAVTHDDAQAIAARFTGASAVITLSKSAMPVLAENPATKSRQSTLAISPAEKPMAATSFPIPDRDKLLSVIRLSKALSVLQFVNVGIWAIIILLQISLHSYGIVVWNTIMTAFNIGFAVSLWPGKYINEMDTYGYYDQEKVAKKVRALIVWAIVGIIWYAVETAIAHSFIIVFLPFLLVAASLIVGIVTLTRFDWSVMKKRG